MGFFRPNFSMSLFSRSLKMQRAVLPVWGWGLPGNTPILPLHLGAEQRGGGLCRRESWALRTERRNGLHEAVSSREITQCQPVGAQMPSRRRGQGRDEEMPGQPSEAEPGRPGFAAMDSRAWPEGDWGAHS